MFEKIGYLAVGYVLYKAVASPRGQGYIARIQGKQAGVAGLGCGCNGGVAGLSRRRRARRSRR